MLKTLYKYPSFNVTFLYVLVEIILWPVGEFPLNDDWAYALSIQNFLDGEFKLSTWQAIPALPQFYLGYFVCSIFGFSFTALRCISIFSCVLLIIVSGACVRRLKFESVKILAVLSLIAFNPLTLNLSNTFLPDVIQLTLAMISFYFMVIYFETKKSIVLVPVVVFCAAATLQRQSALTLSFCFGIVLLHSHPKNIRNFIVALLPLVICFVALTVYEAMLRGSHKLPGNYNLQIHQLFKKLNGPVFILIRDTLYYLITSSVCLGLLISPLVISTFKMQAINLSKLKKPLLVFCGYILLVILKLVLSGNSLPFVGNIFYRLGLGPVIMSGLNTDHPAQMAYIPKTIWIILNVVGAFSFFIGCYLIIKQKIRTPHWLSLFSMLLVSSYLIPICVNYANDRYLLFLLPVFIITYAANSEPVGARIFLIAMAPLFVFALAGELDYLAIHKARLKAANYLLTEKGVEPAQINGGFEFNGWYLSEKGRYIPSHTGEWWWIVGREYVISGSKLPGHSVASRHDFFSWLKLKTDTIYVLEPTRGLQ